MKSTIKNIIVASACAMTLAGCMAAEDDRLEGVALSGGNAMRHNSALQIIDPWPANVQKTDLDAPAERDEMPALPTPIGTAKTL